jgi:hypothetical protein
MSSVPLRGPITRTRVENQRRAYLPAPQGNRNKQIFAVTDRKPSAITTEQEALQEFGGA